MSDGTDEYKSSEQVEPDVLALVEIWRTLDFPESVSWEDESCWCLQKSPPIHGHSG